MSEPKAPDTHTSESTSLDKALQLRSEKTQNEVEAQENSVNNEQSKRKFSAFASLGLLDRFLAVWIFLAMAVGIILGNFVPSMSPALEKGTFVGVSIPIGKLMYFKFTCYFTD